MNPLLLKLNAEKEILLQKHEQSKNNMDFALSILKGAACVSTYLTGVMGFVGYFRRFRDLSRIVPIVSGSLLTGFICFAIHTIKKVSKHQVISDDIVKIDKQISDIYLWQNSMLRGKISAHKTYRRQIRNKKELLDCDIKILASQIFALRFENERLKSALTNGTKEEQELVEIEEFAISFTCKKVEKESLESLFLNEDSCIEFTSKQYESLKRLDYFKKILDWENTHTETPTRLELLTYNMNLFIILDSNNKFFLKNVVRCERNLTCDFVALKHMDKKIIQTGIDYVIENIEYVHEIGALSLLSFFEELLIENIQLSTENIEMVELLLRFSQKLGLQKILSHLISFFCSNRTSENVLQLIDQIQDKIYLTHMDSRTFTKDYFPLLQDKIEIESLAIYASSSLLTNSNDFWKVKKVIIYTIIIDPGFFKNLQYYVSFESVKTIDFSYPLSCYKKEGFGFYGFSYEDCENVFAEAGFVRENENINIFTRNT